MKLKDKVQLVLDESRMMILGVQVLLGFALQAFLTSGYDQLAVSSRAVIIVSLGLLLLAMTLILVPIARHRIVDDGRDTPHLLRFTQRATSLALVPFALAFGGDFYVVGARVGGRALGLVLAALTMLATFSAWYAGPSMRRRRDRLSEDVMESVELEDKIHHVLTEARVVLPGTQALIGFQFIAVLQSGFETLPRASKVMHVVALSLLGVSVVSLMLPAAYHRVAEGGEISERLHRISGAALLFAMASMAFALALDAFIVVEKATGSAGAACAAAGGWLLVSLGTWFGWMIYLRRKRRHEGNRSWRSGNTPVIAAP